MQARAHMTYMQDFTTALAQRFPNINSQYMSFPQPPSWPAQQNEEEAKDEDVAMEEYEDTVDGESDEF